MTIEITDRLLDEMARAMWNADMLAINPTLPSQTVWAKHHAMYRLRAEAACEVLVFGGYAVMP